MVNLTKGHGVNLKKEAPNLKRILIGLGWDPIRCFLSNFDIDASVLCINKKEKCKELVFYGNLHDSSGAIRHFGDNLTGEGDGDDEQIEINLDKLPKKIVKIMIIINIYEAYKRKQHFGKVKNCYVHVRDMDSGKELVRYDVDDDYNKKTGIFVAELNRDELGECRFNAIGEGVKVKNIKEMVNLKCK